MNSLLKGLLGGAALPGLMKQLEGGGSGLAPLLGIGAGLLKKKDDDDEKKPMPASSEFNPAMMNAGLGLLQGQQVDPAQMMAMMQAQQQQQGIQPQMQTPPIAPPQSARPDLMGWGQTPGMNFGMRPRFY